jgi:hypothetical protein
MMAAKTRATDHAASSSSDLVANNRAMQTTEKRVMGRPRRQPCSLDPEIALATTLRETKVVVFFKTYRESLITYRTEPSRTEASRETCGGWNHYTEKKKRSHSFRGQVGRLYKKLLNILTDCSMIFVQCTVLYIANDSSIWFWCDFEQNRPCVVLCPRVLCAHAQKQRFGVRGQG